MEERNIADEATLLDIATAQGLDGSALLAQANADDYANIRASASRAAVDRGVFGAPSYAVGEALFWGQDRLDFLARELGVTP